MSVYVDAAAWPLGRMLMCHMIADSLDELHAMAEQLGVRRHFQASPPASIAHYDICKRNRARAVQLGAIECDRARFVAEMRRIRVKLSATGVSNE